MIQELKTAKDQILELNQALEDLLLTKADVEDAVYRVTKENQRLSAELYEMNNASKRLLTTSKQPATLEKSQTGEKAKPPLTQGLDKQQVLVSKRCDVSVSKIDEEHTSIEQAFSPDTSPGYRERCMSAQSVSSAALSGSLLNCSEPLQIDVSLPSPATIAPKRPTDIHDYHQLPTAVPSATRKKINERGKNLSHIVSSEETLSGSLDVEALSPPTINQRGLLQSKDPVITASNKNNHRHRSVDMLPITDATVSSTGVKSGELTGSA